MYQFAACGKPVEKIGVFPQAPKWLIFFPQVGLSFPDLFHRFPMSFPQKLGGFPQVKSDYFSRFVTILEWNFEVTST